MLNELFLMGKNMYKRIMDIIFVFFVIGNEKIPNNYIRQYGNFIMAKKCLKDATFIIKISIRIIMIFPIWSV